MDRDQALETVLGQIERNFGKGAVMRMSDGADVTIGAVSTGSLALDLALGIGGLPRGRIVEVFGPESSGKTTLVYHVIAEAQRRGGVCAFIDAEHAMDPGVREEDRRQHRRAARVPAGHRRAGARDRRAPDPLRRARRRRDRLGRGADAEGGDRGRDGRLARRPPGAAHEPGAAQARRHAQPHRHDLPLHEPAAREDRRHVRLAGDDSGRPGAEVLRVGAARHPTDRDAEGRRRGVRQPRPRQGRQEQGRAAVQAGGVRHHLRHRDLLGGHRPRHRRRAEGRAEVGRVLLVPGRAARAGASQRDGVPPRAPGRLPEDPVRHPGADRAGADRLRTAAGRAARPRVELVEPLADADEAEEPEAKRNGKAVIEEVA